MTANVGTANWMPPGTYTVLYIYTRYVLHACTVYRVYTVLYALDTSYVLYYILFNLYTVCETYFTHIVYVRCIAYVSNIVYVRIIVYISYIVYVSNTVYVSYIA